MTLGLSTAQLNATQSTHRVVAPLLEMHFDSGTLNLALFRWNVIIGATTYTRAPVTIAPASESAGSTEGLSLTLNGLDPAILTLMTQEPYQGRVFRLLKAFIQPDSNGVIGDPVPKFLGRMRNMIGTENNAEASVTLIVEHYDKELATPSPLRWTDADQQRLSPGDRGCEYAADNAEKTIIWPSKNALIFGANPVAGGIMRFLH